MQLVENKNLTFDESDHTYRLDGVVLPSVTQIMRPLSDANYNGIPEDVLQKAADRGTAVHQAIDIFLNYGCEDIDPAYRGYLDAFLKWKDSVAPDVCATEQPIYHPTMLYCGTADCVCKIGGKMVLIDYKTTSVIHEKLVSVQLQAYESALKANGVTIDEKRILQLKDSGYKEYVYPADDARSWRVFTSLKTVWDYINK